MNKILPKGNKIIEIEVSKGDIIKQMNIRVVRVNNDDYICLTDMAKYRDEKHPADIIKNWMRTNHTIQILGQWEMVHNPMNFKLVEFDQFLKHSGENGFVLTPQQWIEKTNAIGIISKSGRGGGTYAHKDIAFAFAMWLSPQFQLYIIKDYQKLKEQEAQRQNEKWDLKRDLARLNYRIHTDAIKEHLISETDGKITQTIIYASEADMLNKIVFGLTAQEWAIKNPERAKHGNIRDFADATQLSILNSLEILNAEYISQGLSREERFNKLKDKAISIYNSISKTKAIRDLKNKIDKNKLNNNS